MKNIFSVIIALFAIILAGCTKEVPQKDSEAKTITVSVTMESPEDTRVSLTPTGTTPHGFSLQWEEGDKLMLCFQHNFWNYYSNDAPMVPGSIRNGGKVADFIITIPDEIPANDKFNLYAVYQKTDTDNTNGGYFYESEKRYYVLEDYESLCLTLNQTGYIPRPVLYFSKKNIDNTATPDIGQITLGHTGWILAYHLKNSTGHKIGYPVNLGLWSETQWVCNGPGINNQLRFDCFNNSFKGAGESLTLNINSPYYQQAPYYDAELSNGGTATFYRWVASSSIVPALKAQAYIKNPNIINPWDPSHLPLGSTKTLTPKNPITKGKVYHIYTEIYISNAEYIIEFVSPY